MHFAHHRFASGAIRLRTLAAAALISLTAGASLGAQSSGTLAERIQRIMDRPEFKHALFGIDFYSLDSNHTIYTLNAEKLFVPGSTTKLLTEGTALELLGGDYRFHTRVYRTSAVDGSGTLAGDLVLVASGDPDLSARVRTGFDLEHDVLEKAGLDLTGAQQADGAGGDADFTPAFMVSYLKYMSQLKDSATFRTALPVLGRDGTLWNIQPASPAAGHVFAKTGTFATYDPLNWRLLITGKGLAGYITTADNQHLAFAIYVNNVSVSTDADAATAVVGQALGEIAAAAYEARR